MKYKEIQYFSISYTIPIKTLKFEVYEFKKKFVIK
jgi:hypothetical protein